MDAPICLCAIIAPVSGCRIAVIIPVFQTGDRSSTLRTRTTNNGNSLYNLRK